MQKITTFLWFEDKAEEAVNFYTSIFKNSKIGNVVRYKDVPGPEGKVITATFELEGQSFMALNGGPVPGYVFSPATSFFVSCKDQEEVDYLWDKLSEGGKIIQCGWLTDKYGITWQIVPSILGELMQDKDPEKVARVTQAMLKMTKLNVEELEKAYKG